MDYCDVFISCSFWRHPSTAEDQLVSKWCNVTFLQICSDEETNYILDGLRVSKHSLFGWTIPLISREICSLKKHAYIKIACINIHIKIKVRDTNTSTYHKLKVNLCPLQIPLSCVSQRERICRINVFILPRWESVQYRLFISCTWRAVQGHCVWARCSCLSKVFPIQYWPAFHSHTCSWYLY